MKRFIGKKGFFSGITLTGIFLTLMAFTSIRAEEELTFALEPDEPISATTDATEDGALDEVTETTEDLSSDQVPAVTVKSGDNEKEAAESDEKSPSVSATVVNFAPTDVNEDVDKAYRQLVAGNARFMKLGTPAANDYPRPEVKEDGFPLATLFYSSDITTTMPTLFDLDATHLYSVPIRAGVWTSDELDDL